MEMARWSGCWTRGRVSSYKQLGAELPGDEASESVVLSPDGRTVAYTDGDAIRLLDVATRKAIGARCKVTTEPLSASRSVPTGERWHPASPTKRSGCGIYTPARRRVGLERS
jgi:hypothetical protein